MAFPVFKSAFAALGACALCLAFGLAACGTTPKQPKLEPVDTIVAATAGPDALDRATPPCLPCVVDNDCVEGGGCVTLASGSFCAAPCSSGSCVDLGICATTSTVEGVVLQLCVPAAEACTETTEDAGNGDTGAVDCPWDPPTATSCCVCTGASCQPNGCYGGYFCERAGCKCRAANQVPACALPEPPTDTHGESQTLAVATLDFAIVGDTRPPIPNLTAKYPKPIIAKIWKEVAAELPPVQFAVTTGDYVFATPNSEQGPIQMDMYLAAQTGFPGTVWHALGNHECTSSTESNCGPNGKDGITPLYQAFLDKMVKSNGFIRPWHTVWYNALDGAWSAKFVIIAANAWDAEQEIWLAAELAKPSTYTFVIRHESSMAKTAPGVKPSQNIINQHPLTLLIVGHAHTYEYFPAKREVIVGNGGAPLTGWVNYGYVIARRRADGAMQFTAYDYMSHAVFQTFAVHPDGTPAAIP